MEKKQLIIGSLLTVVSVVVSCTFIAYGAGIVVSEDVPKWIMAFGVVTVTYGICSLAALLMAWGRYGAKTKRVISIFATVYMAVFIIGSMDVGMVSGLEVAGILLVATMLFINWFAVSSVVTLKNVANNT